MKYLVILFQVLGKYMRSIIEFCIKMCKSVFKKLQMNFYGEFACWVQRLPTMKVIYSFKVNKLDVAIKIKLCGS